MLIATFAEIVEKPFKAAKCILKSPKLIGYKVKLKMLLFHSKIEETS